MQSESGSTRALACSDRRPAGRNGVETQSLSGDSAGGTNVVGEGADHGTRGRVYVFSEARGHPGRYAVSVVAQATRLFRRATRQTEWKNAAEIIWRSFQRDAFARSARRVAERGGRVARTTRAKQISWPQRV